MSAIALYTFGLLDPAAEPEALADFSRRGQEIFALSDDAPGFLGRAGNQGIETYTPGEDYGAWGGYALPDLPEFGEHDPEVHIATLSLWRDVESARSFVYRGLHRDALRIRRDWFLKGPWPGYVLWTIADGAVPHWSDGVERYQRLARDGESDEGFVFSPRRLSATAVPSKRSPTPR